jgi:hypothetical protein
VEGIAVSGRLGNHIRKTNGYASKKEAEMAAKLQALVRSGVYRDLKEQVKFELIPKQDGELPCSYIADFQYVDDRGEMVVMDVKGYKTEIYRIKRKLMLWRHGIRITEA